MRWFSEHFNAASGVVIAITMLALSMAALVWAVKFLWYIWQRPL
jgi:hypothetical protein